MKKIIGIDPGNTGAIVYLFGKNEMAFHPMPYDKDKKEISYDAIVEILEEFSNADHIMLERAMPMAMGAKHAFTYGRFFNMLEMACKFSDIPTTYVEPSKWHKELLQGIDSNLKPKARSLIALDRLLPKLKKQIPANKNGKLHEGVVDALLLAEYGRRILK
jgi:hypothetical protein